MFCNNTLLNMNLNSLGGIRHHPPVQSGEGSLTVAASPVSLTTVTAKTAALQPVYPLSCDFFIYFYLFILSREDERLSAPSRLPLPGENVARGEIK